MHLNLFSQPQCFLTFKYIDSHVDIIEDLFCNFDSKGQCFLIICCFNFSLLFQKATNFQDSTPPFSSV